MADYPRIERGFYHLLPDGWHRKDRQPFPAGRLETWAYEMAQLAEDATERICLTRTWQKPDLPSEHVNALHARFGEALSPTVCRNVTLECEI